MPGSRHLPRAGGTLKASAVTGDGGDDTRTGNQQQHGRVAPAATATQPV